MNFNSLTFESPPESDRDLEMYDPGLQTQFRSSTVEGGGQDGFDDMMWETIMDDFTMPPM